MILTPKEAKKKLCPIGRYFGHCRGSECACWTWSLKSDTYFSDGGPYDYLPTFPIVEENETISFKKDTIGTRVNVGVAKGCCGFIRS